MVPKYPPSLLFSLLIMLTYSVSCFGAYHENLQTAGMPYQTHGHVSRTYPPRNDSGHRDRLASLMNYETKVVVRHMKASSPKVVINVDDFGAKADGRTDASEAFKKAWNAACSSRRSAVIVIPKGKSYILKPITFSGPCRSDLQFLIQGTIKASTRISDYEKDRRHWLVFEDVQKLRVRGGGTIDGNGRTWWVKSCKINKSLPCKHAPTAVTFVECKSLIVANLKFLNAQQMHLSFQKCVNVRALNLVVQAPGDSPNTDGIHVTGTKNIRIRKSVIKTGDDCISIVSGSTNVEATDIVCGPGHGISIGSLGADNSEAAVSDIVVSRARFSGTTNGVRIKTWQGGSGYAKNIIFQDVDMHDVTNPIIIDQNYCDQDSPCPEQASAVKISNVTYKNIKGTSKNEVAVKIDCSKSIPCQAISLQDVRLTREENGRVEASCANVRLEKKGDVSPRCY